MNPNPLGWSSETQYLLFVGVVTLALLPVAYNYWRGTGSVGVASVTIGSSLGLFAVVCGYVLLSRR